MGRIRRIIHEVHRRSIRQVLAVYLAGSWVALQVVDALTRTDDPTLGAVGTEALRVNLTSSRVVALVEAAQLEDALRRMGRDLNTPLTSEVAREAWKGLRDRLALLEAAPAS